MEDKKISDKAINPLKLSEVLKDKMGNVFNMKILLYRYSLLPENKSHETFLFAH